jgi:hypothetical protein
LNSYERFEDCFGLQIMERNFVVDEKTGNISGSYTYEDDRHSL